MEHSYLSEIGDRKINEDCLGIFKVGDQHIYILADGLGGHGGGSLASKGAVQAISEFLSVNQYLDQEMIIEHSFKIARKRLKEIQKKSHANSRCMTTLVILAVNNESVMWGHIGDSRLYYFKNGSLAERTQDHSLVQRMVNRGEISEAEIRTHKDRNVLLRALGASPGQSQPVISKKRERLDGSAFLLCTDGFWGNIEDDDMCEELNKGCSASDWLESMNEIVTRNSRFVSKDNCSAIAVIL